MSLQERVLAVVAEVAETDEVKRSPDIDLFDLGILDSLRMVDLILTLSAEFDVDITPAEVDRAEWATPRNIVTFVEHKLAHKVGS